MPSHLNPRNFVRNGKPEGVMKGYSCQIVVDETIKWLESIDLDEKPFFTTVWYHEPHFTIASPPELVEKYQKKHPGMSKKDAEYYANIDNVDIATGRLMAYLKKQELDKNTFIMITSDNGGERQFSNKGLRGRKSHITEGGHRVPGIFRWPGVIPAGTESHVSISGVDYLPTVCAFAGAELPNTKIDGTSLVDILTGKKKTLSRETPLFWFFYAQSPTYVLRDGKWALLADSNDVDRKKTHTPRREDMPFIKASKPVKSMLYDLDADLAQTTNLASKYPEIIDRLKKQMIQLNEDILSESPVWDIPERKTKGKK